MKHIARSHSGKAYPLDKPLPRRVYYWGNKKTCEVAAHRQRKRQREYNKRLIRKVDK